MQHMFLQTFNAAMRSIVIRLLVTVFTLGILASCKSDLLRYGNRATCLGYFAEAPGQFLPDETHVFGFPADMHAAGMQLFWNTDSQTFSLLDVNATLHGFDRSGALGAEQDLGFPGRSLTGLDVSEELGLLAASYRSKDGANNYTTRIYPFDEVALTEVASLSGLSAPRWQPTSSSLAGVYYKDGATGVASNQLALFDLAQAELEPETIYELDNSAIGMIGWSANGQVIAVSQLMKNGLTPTYVMSKSGERIASRYNSSAFNCIGGAQWSPIDQSMVFHGRNETTLGWDIFLEKVAAPGGQQNTLINLTESPEQDEIAASWSPNGAQLVYAKAYLGADRKPRQELYLLDFGQPRLEPVQLTDTGGELESNPMWISDKEIAYASWSLEDSSWYVKILALTKPTQESETIMEVPESWYRVP